MSKDAGAIPYCNGAYVSDKTYLGKRICTFCNYCSNQKDYKYAYGCNIKTCRIYR